jgi:D-amino-acid oxidase
VVAVVTVVGGGVIGLTSALGLARAGHTVRCVRDEPVADTTSAVAGGLWFPYHVEPRDRVLAWGRVALDRFTDLARDPDAGVAVREGVVVERGVADRWWTAALPTWREAQAGELPAGAPAGVVASVPLVTMPVFLPWLETRCVEAGVELELGWVSDLAQVRGEVVVVAAGLRSGTLVDDHAGTPSRGQVALLANPGLTHWLIDNEHPEGMVYVLPHPGWVVCGGTDVAGSWDVEPDRHVHDAIVRRVRTVVPALARAEVLGARVGLRPVAPEVRLTASEVDGRPVVVNYGHGGAGVTLSWGCADDVVRLVGKATG